jgi:aspartokinase/homoserine dehydrogenase 1
VIHGRFWRSQENKYCCFFHGLVGGTLINQILESAAAIEKEKIFKLNVFAIANSKNVLLNKKRTPNWKKNSNQRSRIPLMM